LRANKLDVIDLQSRKGLCEHPYDLLAFQKKKKLRGFHEFSVVDDDGTLLPTNLLLSGE
jgi:hypothetical protein